MRILLAIPCLERGGTEMQTLYLAKSLLEAGHSVDVVCYFEIDQSVVDEFVECGCGVDLLRLDRGLSSTGFVRLMRAYYRRFRPDVLHVQYMTPGALSILAARLAGVPNLLATVHQPYTSAHGSTARKLLRFSALLCDRFVAVSMAAEASWFGTSNDCAALTGRKGPRHCTIYNAVDTKLVASLSDRGQASLFRERYRLGSTYVFGYIGRLSHEKGVDILIRAFGMVASRNKGVSLLIVGDGSEAAAVQKRFGHEEWWGGIVFAGNQSWREAMRHLSVIDSLVVPSRFEGFGLSAVEAMAATRPVIAARTGGLTEIVCHGTSGFLYDTEDVAALAELMGLLAGDEQLSRQMSANARERSLDFDVELYSRKIQKLYASCKP